MRPVHDILYDRTPGRAPGPCAFIQHGNEETGFEYQTVCVWCAQDVGERITFEPNTYSDYSLLTKMKLVMKIHMPFCTAGGHTPRVYKTTTPLDTDNPPKVM